MMTFINHGIENYEKSVERYEAFWEREIIDRVPIYMTRSLYPTEYCSLKKWQDIEYTVNTKIAMANALEYYGDAFAIITPNIGPDYFASLYGATIDFEQSTSFIKSPLTDIEDFFNLNFSLSGTYFEAVEECYNLLFSLQQENFFVGWVDLHPGADALSALRSPAGLCLDLYDQTELVKKVMTKIDEDFKYCFNYYIDKISKQQNIITGWPIICSKKRWHVPSNDFSYMISEETYKEFFLESLEKECAMLEASLYHLDGPGSLTQLETILTVKNLNAVQWAYGAGNGSAKDWIHVYKKIQQANKSIQIEAKPQDIDTIIANLKPHGIMLRMNSIDSLDTAEKVLKKVNRWR